MTLYVYLITDFSKRDYFHKVVCSSATLDELEHRYKGVMIDVKLFGVADSRYKEGDVLLDIKENFFH